MESPRRRWTAGDGVEAALASSRRPGVTSVSDIPERRRAASPVEERENHPAQEAGQGQLQGSQVIETDLTSIDSGQDSRGGRGRPDLIRGRDIQTATHQPFRRKEATIGRAGSPAPSGAHLQSMAQPEGPQPNKLRRKGSIQRGIQGSITAETGSQRHPQGVSKVDRRFLLQSIRDDHSKRLHLWATGPATGWASARVAAVTGAIPFLQRRPRAIQDRCKRWIDRLYR